MPLFLWNPVAVSYLAQLALVLAISLYFLHRVIKARRRGESSAALTMLFLTVAALAPVVALNVLRSGLVPAFVAYILPWISPFWAVSICAFIRFAYRFPQRLPAGRWEVRLVALLSGGFIAAEAGVAVWRFLSTLQGDVWFRPPHMDYPVVAGVLWALVVLARQLIWAIRHDAGKASISRRAALILWQSPNREAWAARAFFLFALLPLAQVLLYALRANSLVSIEFTEIAATWILLAMVSGYALVFLNYLPEHSSVQVKIAGGTLTIVLAVIVAVSWLIGPVYTEAYRTEDRIHAHQTYRFEPDGRGGYRASAAPYHYDVDPGAAVAPGRIALPFEFRFYGKVYHAIHVRDDGIVGFERFPNWGQAQLRYGRQPTIYPVAVELAGYNYDAVCDGCGLKVKSLDDRIVITWDRLQATMKPADRYSFQMTLYQDGTIDLSYAEVPKTLRYDLVLTNLTAWMVGITPGDGRVKTISLTRDLPLHAPPGTGIMADHYIDFLRYIDRAYAPVAAFLVFAVLLTLVVLPAFLRGNLVRPLDRLLTGVQAFRNGELRARVPVSFHDEIGFLTGAFNDMATAQQDLVDTLEHKVAERTRQVAEVTARNARLEERVRLSGDLHDTVSQTLFSAAMLADSLPAQWKKDAQGGEQALERLGGLSRHALAEMRQLLTDLRASGPDETCVGAVIEKLVRDFQDRHAVTVELAIADDAPLPAEVYATFHRFAQEALNNIAKHAAATSVKIVFESLGTQALLTVGDDGCGFDPATVGPAHLGLQIMRERSGKIGAELDIVSAPGQGTTLTLIWLPKDEP